MRRLYKLKPLRLKMFTDFYVWDTETGKKNRDGSIQWHLNGRPESFQFGIIYGHNFSKIIYSVEEFKNEFKDPRYKGKKIFAHNAEYDLNTIYGNIYKEFPDAIFNGKFICCGNGNCLFADSTNILGKIKLADVGKMLGIQKPDLGDENLFSKKGIGAAEINRCMTDCEITYEALAQIFQAAGDVKITQASLSMAYYRRHHQPYHIDYNENTTYFFDSYYGGRTEAFKIGPTYASVIDVNSMYPYAMRTIKFPNPKLLKCETRVSIKYFLNQILYNYEGCIYARVVHHKRDYGFLPYKMEQGNGGKKLLFPVGEFSGCWNFNEFRFALEQGAIKIKSITRIVYAPAMDSPFKTYVDTLYAERFKTQNKFEIYRIKIFMNSLYGKFAQRITEESTYIEDINLQYEVIRRSQEDGSFKRLVGFNKERNDAFLITNSSKTFTISYSIPSFASYITSFCRVLLLSKILELHNRKVVYCDTDSIFFEINDGIKNDMALGGWKVEDKIITEIQGLKNYKFEYVDKETGKRVKKHRIKGVPEKADIIAPNTFEYTNLLKTKESLRRKLEPGVLTKRIKKISGLYTKRIVLENGETKPIEI